MSRNIAISDEVYQKLKREKGDRSFSEVIAAHLEGSTHLADVSGQGLLDEAVVRAVSDDIEELSDGTLARIDDDAP